MNKNYIIVKNYKLYLDGVVRESPNGKNYRLSAIKKNSQLPSKWLKRNSVNTECWHWQYIFIYTDTNELFGFEYDFEDRFVGRVVI